MSLRIEQNWKWSNKTFPHTLCVVSTSDETTHSGICLTSNKNLYWASGGRGGSLGQKLHFLGQFSPWKLEICWVNVSESRLTLKIWLHDSRISPFLSCHLQGGKRFLTSLKDRHFWRHFFLTSTPIYIKIETGCKYFTPCEPFHD